MTPSPLPPPNRESAEANPRENPPLANLPRPEPLGYPLVKIESGDMDGMLYRKRLVGHPFDDSGLDINHASKRPRPDSLNGSRPQPQTSSLASAGAISAKIQS